jgi:hypothetical protein
MLPTKVWFIWPNSFREEDFLKLANQKQELPMVAMFVNGSGQNEQLLERTFHRCFLSSFSWFGWGVSEEKIKMWKVNGRQMPNDGKSSLCLWQGELKMQWCLICTKKWNSFFSTDIIKLKRINNNLTWMTELYSMLYWRLKM